jgi:hypothetical protein
MKRNSSPPPDTRRRKSTRIAAQARKCPLLKEGISDENYLEELEEDIVDLCDVTEPCGIYNTWLSFAQNHPDALEGSEVVEHGTAFQSTVLEIRKTIADARKNLEAKRAQMISKLLRFGDSIQDLDEWYEGGDIFGLSLKA